MTHPDPTPSSLEPTFATRPPPLGSILFGGVVVTLALAPLAFLAGMGNRWRRLMTPPLDGFDLTTILTLVAVALMLVLGAGTLISSRRALRLAPWSVALFGVANVLSELVPGGGMSTDLVKSTMFPIVVAAFGFLIARGSRREDARAPSARRWMRLAIAGVETTVAGLLIAMGVTLCIDVAFGRVSGVMPDLGVAARKIDPLSFRVRLVSTAELGGDVVPASGDGRRGTLVHYWATWCSPCVHELPRLAAAARRLREHDIRVVLVNVDESNPDRVRGILERHGVPQADVASVLDPKSLSWGPVAAGCGGALPTSIVLDADGNPLAAWIGGRDEEGLVTATRAALARPRR